MRVGALHTCPKRRAQTGRATYARRGAAAKTQAKTSLKASLELGWV